MNHSNRSFILLLSPIFCASSFFGQTGIVKSGGQTIPGATISATLGTTKLTSLTDDGGRYSFTGLTAGTWNFQVDMFGFQPARKEVQVTGAAQTLDWTLELRSGLAAQGSRRSGAGFASLQAEGQIAAALANGPAEAGPAAGASDSGNESFLVNGSLSRGLPQGMNEDPSQQRGLGQGPNGAGAAGNPTAGAPPGFGGAGGGGGFGGGGGRGGGGFGGGGGGRGGGGGFGQRRPGGANGQPPFFGNRANRGGNSIRGAAFLTLRNSALDARQVSLNGENTAKAAYAQTRFGFLIGGPLVIPKVIKAEQTFFFINYFGTRARNPQNLVSTVPTLAERNGDFSQVPSTIYDAFSHMPLPGNIIPASQINSISRGLLSFVPLPNQPGNVQNYQLVASVPQNSDNLGVRLNHNFGKKDRLALNLNYQRREGEGIQLYGYRDETSGYGASSDLSWTHTFTPTALSSLHWTFNRNRSNTTPFFADKTNVAAALGIQGTSQDPLNFGPPNLSFTNFGSLSDASPLLVRNQSTGVSESFTWVRGNHSMSFGGEYKRLQLNTRTDSNGRGTFTFTGLATSAFDANGFPVQGTGYDLADFLLGFPQSSSIRYGDSNTYFRGQSYAAFAQDDWRLGPNFSLVLGLRYEYFTPLREKYDRIANLAIAPGFTAASVVTPGQADPYGGSLDSALVNPDKNNFSPRLGLAWKPLKATQIRAGYGWYYNNTVYNQIASRLAAQPPFAISNNVNTSLNAILTVADGFTVTPDGKTVTNTFAVDPNYRMGYAQTWNASIQRDLPKGIVLELGYLGTKGTRLDIQRSPNRAAPGSPLTSEDRRRIGNAVGFIYESSDGNSIYHALQVRGTRRFRRGLSANLLYTFSKSIDDSSTFGGAGNTVAQNDLDLRAERGLSSFDRRHVLSLNWVATSPVGGPNGYLKESAVGTKLLKDWTLSGGITASSGTPLTARVLGNQSDTSGTGVVGSGRADATGIDLSSGGGFFNSSAFAVPPSGRYGDAGRNTIPGPAIFSLNASLGRSFSLTERKKLEFRIDTTNLTNTVSITNLYTVVNAVNYGLPSSAAAMRTVSATLRFRF